jgi:hypothetical protein
MALASSKFAGRVDIDRVALRRVAVDLISRQTETPQCNGRVVVADTGAGGLSAVFVGFVQPLYACLNVSVAADLIWFAEPGSGARASLGVLDAFIEWADSADHPVIHRYAITDAITNPDAIGALLTRRHGFRLVGGLYEKGL